jgi:hypothetical protein
MKIKKLRISTSGTIRTTAATMLTTSVQEDLKDSKCWRMSRKRSLHSQRNTMITRPFYWSQGTHPTISNQETHSNLKHWLPRATHQHMWMNRHSRCSLRTALYPKSWDNRSREMLRKVLIRLVCMRMRSKLSYLNMPNSSRYSHKAAKLSA